MAAGKSTAGPVAPDRLHLVYADECEVHRHPRLAKVWRRRGRPLKVPAAGEDRRFGVFGALDYASGRLIAQVHPKKGSAAFVAFLDHLVEAIPDGPLVVVLDNVGYLKSHEARRWWLDRHDRVRPLWLPAYAPELNLIERVWRHVKDKLSCHRWWADLDALQQATEHPLSRLQARFHQPDGGISLVQDLCQSA